MEALLERLLSLREELSAAIDEVRSITEGSKMDAVDVDGVPARLNPREVFQYLFRLQEGGSINMLACKPYLMDKFGMEEFEADDVRQVYVSQYAAMKKKYDGPAPAAPATPPRKKKGAAETAPGAPVKPKKVLSPEHLAAMKAGREAAKARKAAEKAAAEIVKAAEGEKDEVLDD